MAQRLRLGSVRGIAALHRVAGWVRWLRGAAGGGPVRLQPEEERSRPGRAGDLSRDGGKRAMVRVLPGEAVIEHQHVIGSTLPFPNQPGSGLQFGARRRIGCSGLLELLCNLAELAQPPRAQPAKGDFLHPVSDSSHQQLAAEMRRCLGFVESAPLLTKFAKVELGEARERLQASCRILDRSAHACSGAAMRYTRPRSSWVDARLSPSFFFRVPEKRPRTVCRCQPMALAISSTVAPSGRCSIAITASCFDERFVSDGWSGSGRASIANHS